MNRRIAALLLIVSAPLATHAQQTSQAQPTERKMLVAPRAQEPLTYEFEHIDSARAYALLHLAEELLGVAGQFQPEFHLAIFRNPKSDVQPDWKEKTVAFLKKYDVAPATPPQVHYTAYLIRASRKPGSNSEGTLPKDVQEAVNEMKRSLPYARYELATVVTTVSEGGAEASDALPQPERPKEAGVGIYYNILYGGVSVSQDRKAISIRPFRFWTRGPSGNKDDVMASISSDVTIHEGQKLVLGKLQLNGDDDLFIILTAKVE